MIGGSYGGYMVLASMTHYNDRLRGAIDIVGISNFVTFLESTAEYRRDLRRPSTATSATRRCASSSRRSRRSTTRARSRSRCSSCRARTTRACRSPRRSRWSRRSARNGGEVWYLVGLNEGHGFAKRDNVDYYQWAVAMFLEKLKQSTKGSLPF